MVTKGPKEEKEMKKETTVMGGEENSYRSLSGDIAEQGALPGYICSACHPIISHPSGISFYKSSGFLPPFHAADPRPFVYRSLSRNDEPFNAWSL
jgi:hypothetical protein